MELNQTDSGGRRSVRVGDDLIVVLAENPTTGYRWYADIDAAALRQTGDQFDGSPQPRGAAGTRRLTFTTLRPGPTQLKVLKRRSWETVIVEDFELEVEVE